MNVVTGLMLGLALCTWKAAAAAQDAWDRIGPAHVGVTLEQVSATLEMRCDQAMPLRQCTCAAAR